MKDQKSSLLARLSAAAGILLGTGYRDSSEAVTEAKDILSAPQPALSPAQVDSLRSVRRWHYEQYQDYAARASELMKKAGGRLFEAESRDAFERAAEGFQTKANAHLRFVRSLNGLFPANEAIK